MTCAPHDPGSGTSGGTGKCQKLHSGIAIEGCDGDDAILDGRGGPGTDGEGTGQLKDQTEDHGLLVGDGARRDARSPGVGNIV